MPNKMSNDPTTIRAQDAQAGGDLRRPPNSSDPATNIAVTAISPSTQPPRNASPVGRGRGACSTNTAGMMVIGETAITSARGTRLASTEPEFPVTGSNFRIDRTHRP